MSSFQAMPNEVLEQIFAYSENPRLSQVCSLWRNILHEDHYATIILETYQRILPKDIFLKFISRIPPHLSRKKEGFRIAIQRQLSCLGFCREGKGIFEIASTMFPSPLSIKKIQKLEECINLNEELDLHYLCMQILNKPEIQLVEEGFAEGMKLILKTVDNCDQLKKIIALRSGTSMWTILKKHVDLARIKTLEIPKTMLSIPPQIIHLTHLRTLNLADGGRYRLPVELSQMKRLKWLCCGIATDLYIPEELWANSNAAIHTALLRWRFAATSTTPIG